MKSMGIIGYVLYIPFLLFLVCFTLGGREGRREGGKTRRYLSIQFIQHNTAANRDGRGTLCGSGHKGCCGLPCLLEQCDVGYQRKRFYTKHLGFQ